MNTPTPETDAKQKLKDMIGEEYVSTDFARKLERERDELAERLDFQRNLNRECIDQITSRTKERDEVREQLAAERELADRLALQLKPLLIATWREKSPTKAELAIKAWQEARR